jgi:hypothetical protein
LSCGSGFLAASYSSLAARKVKAAARLGHPLRGGENPYKSISQKSDSQINRTLYCARRDQPGMEGRLLTGRLLPLVGGSRFHFHDTLKPRLSRLYASLKCNNRRLGMPEIGVVSNPAIL